MAPFVIISNKKTAQITFNSELAKLIMVLVSSGITCSNQREGGSSLCTDKESLPSKKEKYRSKFTVAVI
jgi:hypothetical protein